jgi:type 2A phosphatase activator TIP41
MHNATLIHQQQQQQQQHDGDDNIVVVEGISIRGGIVEVYTRQGPMASDIWMTQTTDALEQQCQPTYNNNNNKTSSNDYHRRHQRRLNIPEMVFPQALVKFIVVLHKQQQGGGGGAGVSLQWTALDALEEWAKAHQQLALGRSSSGDVVDDDDDDDSDKHHHYLGVSVLKAIDAALWSSKQQQQQQQASAVTSSSTDFYYDWTFSSPFVVKTIPMHDNNDNDNIAATPHYHWKPLQSSGINMALLQDTSQPILFFDEIELYEDDLHDNGDVSYKIKVRVMPTCVFLLSRLWLRVDHVLLRVKETRCIVELFDNDNVPPKIYRDVLWREAKWKDLVALNLPTNVRAWRLEASDTDASSSAAPALMWQQLMNRLPVVDLPPEIPAHAMLEIAL